MFFISRGQITNARHKHHKERRVTSERRGDVKVEHTLHGAHDPLVRHHHKDEILRAPQENEGNNREKWKESWSHSRGVFIPTISDRRQLEGQEP